MYVILHDSFNMSTQIGRPYKKIGELGRLSDLLDKNLKTSLEYYLSYHTTKIEDVVKISSENLVIYCELNLNSGAVEFVVKFKLIKKGNIFYVQNMTKDHCDSIIKNYIALHKFIKDMKNKRITVVPLLIL